MKKCIILANGNSPSKEAILYLLNHGYSTLFCADGGANTAYNMRLAPAFIIGDFDSIHQKTLIYFKDKSTIIKLSRQNDTDVEKCLKHAVKLKFNEAILTGVTGNRLDHTICNLGIALKFSKKINVKILAENSLLTVLSGKNKIQTTAGETISIYGIDKSTKIFSKGLKYQLSNESLAFGYRESTSNIAIENQIELKISSGSIFFIRDFKTAKKHGFI